MRGSNYGSNLLTVSLFSVHSLFFMSYYKMYSVDCLRIKFKYIWAFNSSNNFLLEVLVLNSIHIIRIKLLLIFTLSDKISF